MEMYVEVHVLRRGTYHVLRHLSNTIKIHRPPCLSRGFSGVGCSRAAYVDALLLNLLPCSQPHQQHSASDGTNLPHDESVHLVKQTLTISTSNRQNKMGLVDYSDSDSDNDSPQPPYTHTKTTTAPPAKKPFQKLVDKTNSGKILVSLPSAAATDDAVPTDEPAAKRIKTGTNRFSGFGSFLPAPKAAIKATTGGTGSGKAAPKVGINLKTSSEVAFSREAQSPAKVEEKGGDGTTETNAWGASGLKLPPPKTSAQPSIPEGQKPEEEVKLVGKSMMFRPLSVSRKPAKKNGARASTTSKPMAPASALAQSATSSPAAPSQDQSAAPPPKKKISLFSLGDDTPDVKSASEETGPYEPEFTTYDSSAYTNAQVEYATHTQPFPTGNVDPTSLDSIADDLNLDPVARRELFGRGGGRGKATAKSVINFNLDREYQHNEELRASGALEQQQHNPLRAIKPGKHSLQQLVNQVQSQRDALEENFAKNRATQKQAGSKYGFR